MSSLTPENQKLLIEAYLKLLDTLSCASVSRVEPQDITVRRVDNRYLVYVHGISTHEENYSKDWWEALQPFVTSVFGNGDLGETRREVIWSDLVNQQSTRSVGDTSELETLRREIELILQERQQQMIADEMEEGQRARQLSPSVRERGGGFSLDDFLIYMVNPTLRQQIIDRFTKVVQPLLANGSEIDIISHSWGSVVSYEGLRELEQQRLSGRVNTFFTVGSALSLGPVRATLRKENQDGRSPTVVDRWVNLDAQGDLVGGVLGDYFNVDHEHLKLTPVGCSRFLGLYNLGCAHSSYFDAQNVAVNQDIFARYIL